MRSFAQLLGVLLVLVGCEQEYGVYRAAILSEAPDGECIQRVLNTTPGITSVQYFGDTGYRGNYYFAYEGEEISAIAAVILEEDGEVRFAQSHVLINRRPPKGVLGRTRSIMRAVEERLEAECGMVGLTSAVRETCLRIECDGKD